MDKSLTVKESLDWAGAFLTARGISDGRLSAEVILCSLLSLGRAGLITRRDQILAERDRQSFQEKLVRRAAHEPVAYLVGEKEFWSLSLDVNPGVLIPRPETELLVKEALLLIESDPNLRQLVELGTGSGAIAVALAKSAPAERMLEILATDRSAAALRTAAKNASRHGVGESITFVQGDWLNPFSRRRRWIDLLLANPPYIASDEMSDLPETVKAFEPRQALEGGLEGLEDIRTILTQAKDQMIPGGWLLMEIGETQGEKVLQLTSKNQFSPASILKDYAGKDRLLKARFYG
jgi:release factor glutamine methyltransferase